MELNENLANCILKIFPDLNLELDSELEVLFKNSTEDLNEISNLIPRASRIIMDLFDYRADKFEAEGYNAVEFMHYLQQNHREVLTFLEKYPLALEELKNFFRILGRKR